MNRPPNEHDLAQRVEALERAVSELATGIVAMSRYLPVTVQWVPDVKEALASAREICERVAAGRRPDSIPPPRPTSESRIRTAPQLDTDPRIHKTRKP